MTEYHRFVAIGDSQTEGIGDGDEINGYRGWADRLAEQLAQLSPDFRYANLAVRGKLTGQVHAEQLAPALALRPDLVTVIAGVNDVLRPRFDAASSADHLEKMFAELAATGAHVVTMTFPDIGRIAPLARPLQPRVVELNALIRAAGARHGVTVVDTEPVAATTDARLWSHDRVHASPLGHRLIAAAVADALGVPGSSEAWRRPLSPAPQGFRVRTELSWAVSFLGPWLGRRLLGRSSGDDRTAKRPVLMPLTR